jgi:predicted MFS family arabinose efflux permease
MAGLVTAALAPYWITRINPKYAVGGCLALEACGLLGLSIAPSLPFLFLAQVMIGAATIGVASICLTVLAQSRALGLKITSDVVFAGTFLAVAPVTTLGLTGFVSALSLLFLIAIGAATPRLPPRAIERMTHVEASALRAAPIGAWLVLAALMIFYVGGNALWVFLAKLGEYDGFQREVVSDVIAAGLFAGIVGSLGATFVSKPGPRFWVPLSGGLSFLVSTILLVSTRDLALFIAAVFVFNAGWNFYTPFLMGLVAERDPSRRMSSLIPAAVQTGGIVGPTLMGLLMQSSGAETATFAMTAASATSVIGFVLLAKAGRKPATA